MDLEDYHNFLACHPYIFLHFNVSFSCVTKSGWVLFQVLYKNSIHAVKCHECLPLPQAFESEVQVLAEFYTQNNSMPL